MYIQYCEKMVAQQQEKELATQAGFIPTDGSLVKINEIKVPDKDGNLRKLQIPYSSIMYLAKRLDAQGSFQEVLEQTRNVDSQANIAAQLGQFQGSLSPQAPAPQADVSQTPGLPAEVPADAGGLPPRPGEQ